MSSDHRDWRFWKTPLVLMALFILLMIWFLSRLWRGIKLVFRNLAGLLGGGKIAGGQIAGGETVEPVAIANDSHDAGNKAASGESS